MRQFHAQKHEFVFLPVSKLINGSFGSWRSVAQSVFGKIWRATRREMLYSQRSLCRRAVASLHRRKAALATIHGHQVSHELPRYRQSRAIGVSFVSFPLIKHGYIGAITWCHLGGLDQRRLEKPITLF